MLKFTRHSLYRALRLAADTGLQQPIAELPVDRLCLHAQLRHDRTLSRAQFPLVVDPLRLRFSGRPFIENYRWDRDRGARFQVIDKETGKVVKMATAEACFAFHQ